MFMYGESTNLSTVIKQSCLIDWLFPGMLTFQRHGTRLGCGESGDDQCNRNGSGR